jgi:hypothetical protein
MPWRRRPAANGAGDRRNYIAHLQLINGAERRSGQQLGRRAVPPAQAAA